jgi:hypothetical protein
MVVRTGDEMTVWPDVSLNAWLPRTPSSTVTLVTDRKVYKAGDVVSLKGYLRTKDGSAWRVPSSSPDGKSEGAYVLTCQWDNSYSNDPENPLHTIRDFDVDPTFGSFGLEITIPDGASYGNVDLNVRGEGIYSSTEVIISGMCTSCASLPFFPNLLIFSFPSFSRFLISSFHTFSSSPLSPSFFS